MATGGARPGAGRPKKGESKPKKVLIKRTKTVLHAKATISQSTKQALTERLIDKVVSMKVTPLEVMLMTMKLHFDSGQDALLAHDLTEDKDMRLALMRAAKIEMNASSSVAEKVAPYLHPKLQTTVLKGDSDHPLNISGSLRGLSSSELSTMEDLLAKVVTVTPT